MSGDVISASTDRNVVSVERMHPVMSRIIMVSYGGQESPRRVPWDLRLSSQQTTSHIRTRVLLRAGDSGRYNGVRTGRLVFMQLNAEYDLH